MRCFIDTNILISAGLFPESVPALALEKALTPPHVAVVCDYALSEMHRVTNRKFPHRSRELDTLLYRLLYTVDRVATPNDTHDDELKIRDINDRPLLRAALEAKVDVFITGDRDFLESTITNPKIITASEFVRG